MNDGFSRPEARVEFNLFMGKSMSEDQIKKLLEEAAAGSRETVEKLKAAAELKGSDITDDELNSVVGGWGGASTACAACVVTTPIGTVGSIAGSIIAGKNE